MKTVFSRVYSRKNVGAVLLCILGGSLYAIYTVTQESAAEGSPAFESMQIYPEVNKEKVLSEINNLQAPMETVIPAELSTRLADIEMDGALEADADGNLILSPHIKDFFEYLFVAVGDVDAELVVAFIHYYADNNLPATAANQAKQILSDYLIYKKRAQLYLQTQEPHANATPLEAIEQAHRYLVSLRREQLGVVVANAIFAEEQSYRDYTLARAKVMQDSMIPEKEKAQHLTALVNHLPPRLAQLEKRKQEKRELAQVTMTILQSADTESEKRTKLNQYYSVDRVEFILNQQRQEVTWNQHYKAYRKAKQSIEATTGLSDVDMAAEVQWLRQHYFVTPGEKAKADVYDAVFE